MSTPGNNNPSLVTPRISPRLTTIEESYQSNQGAGAGSNNNNGNNTNNDRGDDRNPTWRNHNDYQLGPTGGSKKRGGGKDNGSFIGNIEEMNGHIFRLHEES